MKRERAHVWLAAIGLMTPVLYVGAYLWLLEPAGFAATVPITYETHYRIADDTAQIFFYPLNRIDRLVRPSYWTFVPPPGPVGPSY